MTGEEAIQYLKRADTTVGQKIKTRTAEALEMAIKALEQFDVLGKIRAEIEDIAFDWQEIDCNHESYIVVDLNDALQIIDKYRAESGVSE